MSKELDVSKFKELKQNKHIEKITKTSLDEILEDDNLIYDAEVDILLKKQDSINAKMESQIKNARSLYLKFANSVRKCDEDLKCTISHLWEAIGKLQ